MVTNRRFIDKCQSAMGKNHERFAVRLLCDLPQKKIEYKLSFLLYGYTVTYPYRSRAGVHGNKQGLWL